MISCFLVQGSLGVALRRLGAAGGLAVVCLSMVAVVASAGSSLAQSVQSGVDATMAPPATVAPAPIPATPLAAAIGEALSKSGRLIPSEPNSPAQASDLEAARSFYASRAFEPLWTVGTRFTSRAEALMAELRNADDWGLRPADFPLPQLDAMATLDTVAKAELALTGAALKYVRHARGGRIPDPETLLSGFIDRRPTLLPPATVLTALAGPAPVDATLRGFNPKHRQFELLRQAYLKTRGAAPAHAAVLVPASGPDLLQGKTHPDVAILRRRLSVAVADGASPELFDATLAAAVRAFQAGAGLRADAVVGNRTRRALNVPAVQAGADRLLANMEQWRWMPAELGETRIEVNIPEQQVRFIKDGQLVHTERVIVGKMDTATPIFSDEMETVVFQPKWGVPDSIKVNELLPSLQAGYGLKRGLKMSLNGREVDPWNIDWSRADITKYLVYQPSGDDNALGVVKFLFPNKHAVYLHDTPNKRLFSNEGRLYSHGCVRVRNPVRLAELILDSDKGWSKETVRDLLEDGPEDNPVKLQAKIPVHITYFTAVADEKLDVRLASDVYGHEKRISLALQGRFDRIVKLDPKPVEVKPVRQFEIARQQNPIGEDGDEFADTPRVRVNGRYPPPAALGYYAPVPAPGWQIISPTPQKSAPSAGRYGGNTTNDMIMRSLGGF